jgi:glycosyltransferase involved in cell wall biosynthesis
MKDIKVSITFRTFRRSEILERRLGVLTHLDFLKDEYETIVVDDGFADSTPEIVKNFQKGSPRLTYHFQENSGIANVYMM